MCDTWCSVVGRCWSCRWCDNWRCGCWRLHWRGGCLLLGYWISLCRYCWGAHMCVLGCFESFGAAVGVLGDFLRGCCIDLLSSAGVRYQGTMGLAAAARCGANCECFGKRLDLRGGGGTVAYTSLYSFGAGSSNLLEVQHGPYEQ